MRLRKNEAGYYEATVRDGQGKTRSFSTKQRTLDGAKKVVKMAKIETIEMAQIAGTLTQSVIATLLAGRKLTVESAIEPWVQWMKTIGMSRHSIYVYEKWVGAWARDTHLTDCSLLSITEKEVDIWVNNPGSNKLSSRNVMLFALCNFFKYCSNKGWMIGNPAKLVKVDLSKLSHSQKEIVKQPAFEDSEVTELLNYTSPTGAKPDPFYHAAIAIGRWTGLRLSDICHLEWDSYNMSTQTLTVWTMKRDKRVSLKLEEPRLIEIMKNLEPDDERYMFPLQRLLADTPELRARLGTRFVDLANACFIFGKSFHGLRATYITEAIKAGTPMEHVSAAVGHSSPYVTMGYFRRGVDQTSADTLKHQLVEGEVKVM